MNVAQIFLNTVSNRSAQILDFVAQADSNADSDAWRQLKRIFHSLKSSAVMAGFPDLSLLAEHAEKITDLRLDTRPLIHLSKLLNDATMTPDLLLADNPRFQSIQTEFNVLLGTTSYSESNANYDVK